LAETSDYNPVGRDAGVNLLLDELVEVYLAQDDASLILVAANGLDIAVDGVLISVVSSHARCKRLGQTSKRGTHNIIPPRHFHAHVAGNGN
jgi:hypothetical protein